MLYNYTLIDILNLATEFSIELEFLSDSKTKMKVLRGTNLQNPYKSIKS